MVESDQQHQLVGLKLSLCLYVTTVAFIIVGRWAGLERGTLLGGVGAHGPRIAWSAGQTSELYDEDMSLLYFTLLLLLLLGRFWLRDGCLPIPIAKDHAAAAAS